VKPGKKREGRQVGRSMEEERCNPGRRRMKEGMGDSSALGGRCQDELSAQ
jgi:hypothetical protein